MGKNDPASGPHGRVGHRMNTNGSVWLGGFVATAVGLVAAGIKLGELRADGLGCVAARGQRVIVAGLEPAG